jgi:hypothetical protein
VLLGGSEVQSVTRLVRERLVRTALVNEPPQ